MKKITKNSEPISLTEYKNKGGSFEDLPKDDLRSSLLEEQGFICCYCMRRIPEAKKSPSCKIEHFKCKSNYKELELIYSNILISCSGGEGYPKNLQTCDTYKGDTELSINPSSNSHNIEELIKYTSYGQIYSDDTNLNNELNEVLNLNNQSLLKQRQEIYLQIQQRIKNEGAKRLDKDLRKGFLLKEKSRLLNRSQENKFIPFLMIGVYLLNKKLRKLGIA